MSDNKPTFPWSRKCPCCGVTSTLTLTWDEMNALSGNSLIQDALPNRSPEERELLMTGICGTCWDKHIKMRPNEEIDDMEDALHDLEDLGDPELARELGLGDIPT